MKNLERQLEELNMRRKDGNNDYADNSPLVRAAESLARAYCPELGWQACTTRKAQAIERMEAAVGVIQGAKLASKLREAADLIDGGKG